MMWLAAYLDLEDGDIVALPHSQGSAKGQDSIIVHRSERAVVALTICEDKATENPRDTVREEVWPEIEDYERGERHDELRSNIIATLGTSGIPMTEAVDLIRGISWAGKRRYRVRVTVEPNRRTPKLFNGFDEIVSGGSEMRRGETVPLPSLRTWMATLAGKIETTPLPLSSNAVAPEVAAALLFLIGGYQTDAAETTKAFTPTGTSQATGQLLDFIAALASGNGQELRRIADTLLVMVHRADVDYLDAAADAMWLELARAIQSIARTVLGLGADDSLAVLNGVLERLSRANKEVQLGNSTAWLHLPLAGPYHLARLLHAATEVLRTSTHPITHN